MHRFFRAGEVETVAGRAIVAERYAALRRQVPVIYLLALVNLFGLQIATSGSFTIGLNPPTALVLCAALRLAQWLSGRRTELSYQLMLRRLQQTIWIAAVACLTVAVWCLDLMAEDPAVRLSVLLYGGLAAIGTAYGLSSFPGAARLPLLVLALPLACEALLSDDAQFIGAALSLVVVAVLMLRLLDVNNRHFVGLIESRAEVAREREHAENARREAVDAATTDFLTGLPNRRAFMHAIEVALKKPRSAMAVAVVDLDRFKPTNDTFGHAAGDELLRIVAIRLQQATGGEAIVARLGGDEFAILLPGLADVASATAAGEQILRSLSFPASLNGRPFAISACGGIAVSAHDQSRTAGRLLAEADIALYEAKSAGCGSVTVFKTEMEAPHRRRAQIERALQLPDVCDDIEILFQPIVHLHTGQIVALEALARWYDEELGQVSPAEFVPIAEQLNIIGGLSNKLLERAIAELPKWPPSVRLSFNLSGVQLCSERSAERILQALQHVGIAPARLQVEVTETTLLADFEKARENLQRLRSQGVNIILDDFGAGYASISYLREMQFDQIKLDGSLITAAQTCSERQRLLSAVIGLCQALHVEAVAEHIETEEQLALLLRMGCNFGQGYWLHQPMRGDAARDVCRSSELLVPEYPNRSRQSAA